MELIDKSDFHRRCCNYGYGYGYESSYELDHYSFYAIGYFHYDCSELYDRAYDHYELREHDLFIEDIEFINETLSAIDDLLIFLKEQYLIKDKDERDIENLHDDGILFYRVNFSNIKKALQEEISRVRGISGNSAINQNEDNLSNEEKLNLISELKEQQAAILAKIDNLTKSL